MKIEVKICYSHLIYCLSNQRFMDSINSVEFTRPLFEFEGMNGYIETNATFNVKNLKTFSTEFDRWYEASDEVKSKLYRDLKNSDNCSV